jgi:hypothetical protein
MRTRFCTVFLLVLLLAPSPTRADICPGGGELLPCSPGEVQECLCPCPCLTECGTWGTLVCDDDCNRICLGPPEQCSGQDDNCNGLTDEGFECILHSDRECFVERDDGKRCDGFQLCEAGCTWGDCRLPREICNGRDDNCDGQTDEGFDCIRGEEVYCEVGGDPSCPGVMRCGDDCTWGPCETGPEICNGLDDNCNGLTDEGFECILHSERECWIVLPDGQRCRGDQICEAGCVWGRCRPRAEMCTGRDDNCNGLTDEGFDCIRDSEERCSVNDDSNCPGTRRCGADCTWGECEPPREVCSGRDDNCNGLTDEEFECIRGSEETCFVNENQNCPSTRRCGDNCTWGPCEPLPETCSGRDDNCNGLTDEGFECIRGSEGTCLVNDDRSCPSSRRCGDDCTWGTCAVPPEMCSGRDDNCNGVTDEGFDCVRGSVEVCPTVCGATVVRRCGDDCTWDGECPPPRRDCTTVGTDARESGIHVQGGCAAGGRGGPGGLLAALVLLGVLGALLMRGRGAARRSSALRLLVGAFSVLLLLAPTRGGAQEFASDVGAFSLRSSLPPPGAGIYVLDLCSVGSCNGTFPCAVRFYHGVDVSYDWSTLIAIRGEPLGAASTREFTDRLVRHDLRLDLTPVGVNYRRRGFGVRGGVRLLTAYRAGDNSSVCADGLCLPTGPGFGIEGVLLDIVLTGDLGLVPVAAETLMAGLHIGMMVWGNELRYGGDGSGGALPAAFLDVLGQWRILDTLALRGRVGVKGRFDGPGPTIVDLTVPKSELHAATEIEWALPWLNRRLGLVAGVRLAAPLDMSWRANVIGFSATVGFHGVWGGQDSFFGTSTDPEELHVSASIAAHSACGTVGYGQPGRGVMARGHVSYGMSCAPAAPMALPVPQQVGPATP